MAASRSNLRRLSARCKSIGCNTEVDCSRCGLYALCMTAGLDDPDSEVLEQIVSRRRPVPKRETLFHVSDAFEAVYAVKSGAFKTSVALDDGREQVIGFHFPGELLGLDAIKGGRYTYTAEALEAGSVCEMRFEHLDLLGDRFVEFQEQLVQQLSGQLAQDQWSFTLARRCTAEERLAAFLLDVSSRFAARGLSAHEFRLPMSRHDIASYLGLAVETVSRMFRRFQAQGLLVVSGKYTRLCDMDALRAAAGSRLERGGPVRPAAAAGG